MGFCSGFPYPGKAFGQGFGRQMGRGRGFRSGTGYSMPAGFPNPLDLSPEDERKMLENQIRSLENTLDQLKKKMEGMRETD
jgi:hypothetical protein